MSSARASDAASARSPESPPRSGELHEPRHPIRVVTAASLFDGHDASINIMRRILQRQGAEVIHLGHDRSVDEIVEAAVQEDVQAVAVSSYQGGHVEYFQYLVDRLRESGASKVRVYGGGGGTIIPTEIAALEAYGVAKVFSPEDGQRLGLPGMINTIIRQCDWDLATDLPDSFDELLAGDQRVLARCITALQEGRLPAAHIEQIRVAADARSVPVLGITGTGGSGKSSLTDELLHRLHVDQEGKVRVAVLAIDPTRRRSGGALLGDRIRMNHIDAPTNYFRSLATRGATGEIPNALDDIVAACKAGGYDLVFVETPGIGQGDAGIVQHVDLSLYVMTPEFGAPSQLEKIDMLDYADAVAINKFDRRGAADARRDVARQLVRNRDAFDANPDDMPVFGTIAAHFNDDGVTALYQHLRDELHERGLTLPDDRGALEPVDDKVTSSTTVIVPPDRSRYLAEIAGDVRAHRSKADEQAEAARRRQQLRAVETMLADRGAPTGDVEALRHDAEHHLDPEARKLLEEWPSVRESYEGDERVAAVGDREVHTALVTTSLSGTRIPRVALPRYDDDGELVRWLMTENLPGRFPFTAGVFPFKRQDEDPTRMFAGEGDAFRTNRRFHLLAEGQSSTRLSTAFDSVTLYGFDPDERPDIYGKVGNSGVSIATLDDLEVLFEGFDLCDPSTSVSMTINGPAPTILAMFLNTAIDQQLQDFQAEHGRPPSDEEAQQIRSWVLRTVRGTVQADILKEDQGQNTCIFSTEFALRTMGDVAQWFVDHEVRNFYSVSISGYHIAEAGANPISQLAFTLANGFTYVEAYLARGMDIDDFAPNLSFFFSNGMDPEYSVLGRVARRIWAVAMRDRYGASERSQKLKYHIQTSGRSLHAQEMAFNDIRTTLQALIAVYDNCNSLHTNAYDEAVTTPTAESVRRAMAIQMIINNEWGLARCENPNQGSFIIEELTDLVEEAVLSEFERLTERGGVLGAMETGYQRGRIQDESLRYESGKHDGSIPIVGVNTFRNPAAEQADAHGDRVAADDGVPGHDGRPLALSRASDDEKQGQLRRLHEFQGIHANERPAMLERLRETALAGGNVFAVLMDAVRCCSLGEITDALFEVGGRYRRSM